MDDLQDRYLVSVLLDIGDGEDLAGPRDRSFLDEGRDSALQIDGMGQAPIIQEHRLDSEQDARIPMSLLISGDGEHIHRRTVSGSQFRQLSGLREDEDCIDPEIFPHEHGASD